MQRPDNTTALTVEADLTIDAEARLGIDLQDFEPPEHSFVIVLLTGGTDVGAVSHLTHP